MRGNEGQGWSESDHRSQLQGENLGGGGGSGNIYLASDGARANIIIHDEIHWMHVPTDVIASGGGGGRLGEKVHNMTESWILAPQEEFVAQVLGHEQQADTWDCSCGWIKGENEQRHFARHAKDAIRRAEAELDDFDAHS